MFSIFEYNHYRQFLKDYYEAQKKNRTGFTYAKFSEQAALGSPNYYKLVMDGEKNLTQANIIRFAQALKLKEEEKEYFEALVHFNQSGEAIEKTYYQERLSRLKNRNEGQTLSKRVLEEYEFEAVSNWVHHSIMLMTNLKGFRENPAWIKRRLYDLVSEEEVVRILEQLLAVNLLHRDKDGRLKQTNKRVKTREELKRKSAQVFYEGILLRATQAFKIESAEEREFNAYMVGLSKDKLPELKRRVREFMSSLSEWALEEAEPEQIYSFVFSGFPMTKKDEKP